LGDDVRKYLKEKLPTYAIPEVIIPLDKFPLNLNGKKDKPALPSLMLHKSLLHVLLES
jgi:L-aminoadipate-semialdehyde dehydrogenase